MRTPPPGSRRREEADFRRAPGSASQYRDKEISIYICQVGRVTPCAPQTRIRSPIGAHGVTRPTLPALRWAGALGCNEISVLSYWRQIAAGELSRRPRSLGY